MSPPPMMPPPILNVLQPPKKIESRRNGRVRLRSVGHINYSDHVENAEDTMMAHSAPPSGKPISIDQLQTKQSERNPIETQRLSTETMKALLDVQEQTTQHQVASTA